jgi:hypothetical protein
LPGAALTGHSAKKILKKNYLPGAQRSDTRQRNYKKNKNLCRVPPGRALGKENLEKKIKNLCRVPLTWHLANQRLMEPAP